MWKIDFDPNRQVLSICLKGTVNPEQMRDVAKANARALECTGGGPFKVFVDLRHLFPLDEETVTLLGDVKRVAASVAGFRGFAILADSATVVMQQQRTRVRQGTAPDSELITLNAAEAQHFLRAGD